MKFTAYLKEFNVNISALARKIGVTPSFLCDVKMGRRVPNEAMQERIAEATNNKVKPKDWAIDKEPAKAQAEKKGRKPKSPLDST